MQQGSAAESKMRVNPQDWNIFHFKQAWGVDKEARTHELKNEMKKNGLKKDGK